MGMNEQGRAEYGRLCKLWHKMGAEISGSDSCERSSRCRRSGIVVVAFVVVAVVVARLVAMVQVVVVVVVV
jgi:hypothetical protein